MLQAHYDHSSIFLLDVFGEEYIVQYLNSNWTEALLSFFALFKLLFSVCHCLFSSQPNFYASTGS